MKIVVCGDSFCAAPKIEIKSVGKRAHFSQMLEDQYGHEVIHLAHGGVSNVCIWFQIREAIKLQPQAIVYNKTWAARVEIITQDNVYIERGLKNFIYSNDAFESTGTEHVGNNKTGAVFSTVWQGLKDYPFFKTTDEQRLAVDLYLKHMYNDALDTEVDSWVFDYWRDQIVKHGIVPLCLNDEEVGQAAYDFSVKNEIDCSFHTDRATQEIVAANIDRILKSLDNSQQTN